jgi:hypothetical protein
MPRKAANVPANETNSQRFVRLINARMKTVSQNLKSIGQLGNPASYDSKPEQRKKIREALEGWVKRSCDQLDRGGEETPDFKL